MRFRAVGPVPAPRSPFPRPCVSSSQLGCSAWAGRRRCWGFSAGTRQNRKLPASGAGRGRRGGRRGRGTRWRTRGRECPRCGAPELPGGRVPAMALRLVTDFDLGKDVLPWLRAQRAAGAGVRGGGAGAGGARPGWREPGGRAGRRPSILGGSQAGGGPHQAGRAWAAAGPRQPGKVSAPGMSFPRWGPGCATLTPAAGRR